MKFFIGQVVLFAVALIVLSDALPTNLLKLLEQSQLKNEKRSPSENLLRMLAAELDAPVRRSACTYSGKNYDFGDVILMLQDSDHCIVVYCNQHGTVEEERRLRCIEPEVTIAPTLPGNGGNTMPELGK